LVKTACKAKHRELMPVILATGQAEIGRIIVQGHPRQIFHKTPSHPMAGSSVVCLSSQLCGKHEQEDHCPGQSGIKEDPIFKIINA
jgi:hypothetical protein